MVAASFDEFQEHLANIKEPLTFNEIEENCRLLKIQEKLFDYLELAESNGTIASKLLWRGLNCSSSNDDAAVHSESVKIYYRACGPNHREINHTFNTPIVASKPRCNRLSLPFRSPAVIKSAAPLQRQQGPPVSTMPSRRSQSLDQVLSSPGDCGLSTSPKSQPNISALEKNT